MRPIKFRGRVPDNQGIDAGKIVCGSLLDYGEGTPNCPQFWIRPKDADRNFPVDKDSIAQLVGYDKNGNEVYEGDKVISEYGDEIVARLMDNLPPKATIKEA